MIAGRYEMKENLKAVHIHDEIEFRKQLVEAQKRIQEGTI